MNKVKIKQFKKQLIQTKQQVEKQINNLNAGLQESMADSLGELSLYDNHPADIGNELFQREKDFALKDNAQLQLEGIEKALTRIEDGTYGFCVSCLKPIDEERLETMPEAIHCLECRQEVEDDGELDYRPIEEEIIQPPFGSQDNDSDLQFDGEDAWQAVARYGTSETPSDLSGFGDDAAEYPNVYVDWDEDRGQVEDVEGLPYLIEKNGLIVRDHSKEDSGTPKVW